MLYSPKETYENQRQINLLLGELVGRINIDLVLGGKNGRFSMAYEAGTKRLEIWGLDNTVKLEIG